MSNKTSQKQEGGNNSQNIQVAGNLIVGGISEEQAKEIALRIYKDNFIKLSNDAEEIAISRVNHLVEEFFTELMKRNPEGINSLSDPGMQASLFEAQKEFAKTGDVDLEGALIDMLVDRAGFNSRELKQIVLDESISTISKLTSQQLDILSLTFILTRTVNNRVVNLEPFKEYINDYIIPFIPALTKETSCYEHLVYTGCTSFMNIAQDIRLENILKSRYSAMFSKGFSKDQFESMVGKFDDYREYLTPCLHDLSKFQLNAISLNDFEKHAQKKGLNEVDIKKFVQLSKRHSFTNEEAKIYLLETNPEIEPLLDVWGNSNMHAMALTSVGIAIAQANFRRKTKNSFDLGIWIK